MSFLSRLFSKPKCSDTGIVGKHSMLAFMLQCNWKLVSKSCRICRNTAMVPVANTEFIGQREGEYTVDVGGYCQVCRANRCGVHSLLLRYPLALWRCMGKGEAGVKQLQEAMTAKHMLVVSVLACRKCKTPYALGSKQMAGILEEQAAGIRAERVRTGFSDPA